MTSTRAADSLKSPRNASPGTVTEAPMPWRSAASTSAWASPPSERSCAEVTRPTASTQQLGEHLLGREVDLRRQPAEVAVDDVRPLRAGQLLAGLAEQEEPAHRRPTTPTAYDG